MNTFYTLEIVCKCGTVLESLKVYPAEGYMPENVTATVQERSRRRCDDCRWMAKANRFTRLKQTGGVLTNKVTA